MKKNFLVLLILIIVLLPFLAVAHTTYITGEDVDIVSWQESVNVTIEEGSASGEGSGDINGTVSIDNYFSLSVNSGTFAGFEFGFNDWEASVNGDTYTGISTWFYDPESHKTHIAIGGDIAAIGYGTEEGGEFVLARIGDTQCYGHFTYKETSSSFTSYNTDIVLNVETELFYGHGTGYYNGGIAAYLLYIKPNLSNISIDGLPDELKLILVTYICDLGDGKAFEVWTGNQGLGGVSPPLHGVLVDILGDEGVIIEHVVPLPSTLLLLSSALLGLIGIRRRVFNK